MVVRDYRTAAALFTVAKQRLGDLASPQTVADLLCKRAECLLLMVSWVFFKMFNIHLKNVMPTIQRKLYYIERTDGNVIVDACGTSDT